MGATPPRKIKDVRINGKFSYWTWANNDILAFVSNDSVYHLDITKDLGQNDQVIQRKGNIEGVQIISYNLDPSGSYASISGIGTKDGGKTIDGYTQLHLLNNQKHQQLEAYLGVFGKINIRDTGAAPNVFAYTERKLETKENNLVISELGAPPAGQEKFKITVPMTYPAGSEADFPVFMSFDENHGLLYIATRDGILFIYDVASGSRLLASKVSQARVIVGADNLTTGGLFLFNKQGQIISIDTNESTIVNFIKSNASIPNANQVATNLAIRNGLPGSEQHYIERFNAFMSNQQYKEAAEVVARSPGAVLRNQQTIEKFKALPKSDTGVYPLIQYFFVLLEKTTLNSLESKEICTVVLNQNRKEFVQKWIDNNQIAFTEEVGDVVKPKDANLAAQIYEKANSAKAGPTYLIAGNQAKAQQLMQMQGTSIDMTSVIRDTVGSDPNGALQMAIQFTQSGSVQASRVAEIFHSAGRIQELIQYCFQCMNDNRPDEGQWQTIVLEVCLKSNPNMAEQIFASGKWSQFNKQRLAPLCEQIGLFSRALECYEDVNHIKRVILNTGRFQEDFLVSFLSRLTPEDCLTCLKELIRHNRQNARIVVSVASGNFEKLGVAPVVQILQEAGSFDGIFFFLQNILPNTVDHDIYFKYIEAAVKCNKIAEVEKVITTTPNYFDPVRVKEFLLENRLADPKPLILLCDQNGFIAELIRYLWTNNFKQHINIYLLQVNPNSSPIALATLIDLEAEEVYIKQLLYNLGNACPADELIAEFTKRNKVPLLENWLEQRVQEGNTNKSVHNALARLVISTDKDPMKFIKTNQYYDSKEIGGFCEETDPHLAYECYKRDAGNCDYELIELTNRNALYRLQAKYLVERQDKELWAHVLAPDNPHRQYIVEQIVSTALPESKNVDEVTTTITSFSSAGLEKELISLLEKIVLHSSEFSESTKLQDLLIFTAIKHDKTRVMDYINRLEHYSGDKIATLAKGESFKLYEEAFTIYKKINNHVEAINMLLYFIESIDRAADYAERVNLPETWSVLGKAYISKMMVEEGVEAFLKAKDGSEFNDVIGLAENEEKWDLLVKYLVMARTTTKSPVIDTELLFAYAKLNQVHEIESFIAESNSADIQKVADKCFHHKLFEAAKVFYTRIKSNGRIASCLVHLKQYAQAIDAARKANNIRTWKEISIACIATGEYKLASVAGQNIVAHPDHLSDLIKQYERYNVPEEMINLLESCLGAEKAHNGVYTSLGGLYAKYKPNRLLDFIRAYYQVFQIVNLEIECHQIAQSL